MKIIATIWHFIIRQQNEWRFSMVQESDWKFKIEIATSGGWILKDGYWDDNGIWVDSEIWNDGT